MTLPSWITLSISNAASVIAQEAQTEASAKCKPMRMSEGAFLMWQTRSTWANSEAGLIMSTGITQNKSELAVDQSRSSSSLDLVVAPCHPLQDAASDRIPKD